jgi:hypothetical protein
VVQLWAPPPGAPHLDAWYEPATRHAGDARGAERWAFRGRVERGLEPALWLYADRSTGQELLVDIGGDAHEAVLDPRRRAGVRFDRCPARPGMATILPFRRRSSEEAE